MGIIEHHTCRQQLLATHAATLRARDLRCDDAHASLETSGAILAAIEELTGACVLDRANAAYEEWQEGTRLAEILDWIEHHFPCTEHGDAIFWGGTRLVYDKNEEEWT